MTTPTRVIKIGGSLVRRESIVEQVLGWLGKQTPARNIVMVGGGKLIDAIREIDQVHTLDSEQIHWLCVDLLSATHKIAKSWFPQWNSIDCHTDLQTWQADAWGDSTKPSLIDVNAFYDKKHTGGLPSDWQTTTDSIAAMLGNRIGANEVVLLKACDIPVGLSTRQLAELGIVDDAFANMIGARPFRLVTL